MIEYRAVLQTSKILERPVQSVSLSIGSLQYWIARTLEKYPDGEVIMYKSEEVEIGRFKAAAVSKDCINCGHSSSAHLLTCKTSDQTYGACSHITCNCKYYQAGIKK